MTRMDSPAGQCVVGCVLVAVGMMIAFGLVRIAANLLIGVIGLAAFGGVVYFVQTGAWVGWPDVALGSLGIGFGAALLSLPALPFSSFYKRK